jgi:hypothetical protein
MADDLIDLGRLRDRFDTVGPRPSADNEPPREVWYEVVQVDSLYRAEHPGCEEQINETARDVDWPPALVFENAPPTLAQMPDELFMREFLQVDVSNDAHVIEFVGRWGPLLAPEPLHDPGIVTLVPAAWQGYSREVNEGIYSAWELEEDLVNNELKELTENTPNLLEAIEQRREDRAARSAARARQASSRAASNLLEVVLDDQWRAIGRHRLELQRDERMNVTVDEGEARSWTPSEDPSHPVSLRGFALEHQRFVIALYQAVIESWLSLAAEFDLTLETLAAPLSEELRMPWTSRELSTPETLFELLSTIQAVVTETTSIVGIRIELTHPELEARGGAFGRPVPRIATALCLQLLGWLADGVPARRCANEPCGSWFTRQRGRAAAGQYRTSGVMYCSSSCARAQAQREYRRRRRGQHQDKAPGDPS